MNILLVERDPIQAFAVETALQASAREISRVSNNAQAVKFLREKLVELVVLDWHSSDIDGLDVLRWIRTHIGDEIGVLFLTARALEADVVAALNAGADDYIVRPIREIELAARVNALLRRNARRKKYTNRVEIGGYVLDLMRRTLAFDGKLVDLTEKEFILAGCLFNNLGSVVPRDLLSTLAWGRVLDGTSRSLDTHIYRLRLKLALHSGDRFQLNSVYMHGYRLDMSEAFSAMADSVSSDKSDSL
ncbi:response regulator transcription factor [Burkholderia stagnalis]|uniref:response regulator transcription factor n=1 Tax=Burkholderia stagnalis TaxID=1503054 RepID=UPI000F7FBC7E|nr:response regulator transcription factor [Burkholderia stagnalis]